MASWVRRKISAWSAPQLSPLQIRESSAPSRNIRFRESLNSAKIQELDGAFFEKFGSLLKEEVEREECVARNAGVVDATALSCAGDVNRVLEVPDAGAKDGGDADLGIDSFARSGPEPEGPLLSPRLDTSDSEPEETDKTDLISNLVGWNIEELYSEVLYYIHHNVGCDVGTAADRETLCKHLQDAFKVDEETHQTLLANVEAKEAPKIMLNVEVMEAQDLKPKDANGLCDPFCTLYLNSSTTHRYNTSVKPETLFPTWEEHFSLPVQNPAEDVLCVECWDFDPAETVREKMTKFTDVKGVRGLRKLVKEIAVTASTGKHDNELVGTAQVALNCIPTAGQTVWCNLERKNKSRKQGVIKLRMAFSAEKNAQVARQEHRHLLRLMLLHELDNAKSDAYRWTGDFSENAATIIKQHAVQSGLSALDESMAKWAEFCAVHTDHPLSFIVFAELAKKLEKPVSSGSLSEEEVKLFWDSAKRLLPSCLNTIRRFRKISNCDATTLNQLLAILITLSTLSSMEVPEGTDLFPANIYGWLEGSNCDVRHALEEAIKQGADDWWNYVLENNTADGSTDEDRLRHLIKLVQLVRSDLQKAIEFHDKIFLKASKMPYSSELFKVFEAKICDLTEPVVQDICNKLKPLRFNETTTEGISVKEAPHSMGTTLFELYLALQRLVALGDSLCPNEKDSLKVSKYHTWFHRGVAQWLDIALYKALQRIEKAVELDKLNPVDASVKYSSSAVDTFAIFFQIKIFWQQLSWPDVESSYSFVAKIVDDICRCSVFYADKMSSKVDGIGEVNQGTVHEKKFQVTQEWCLAINNIEYVRQSIEPFVQELGMEDILKALEDFISATAADHCRQTLRQIINNAVDTVRNKIIELLETVAEKMTPAVARFLQEGAELLHQDNNSMDRLMQYLDENLIMLHSELNTENFDRILLLIFDNVSNILVSLVNSSLEKRRPPSFFANLHETLNILVGFFKQGDLQQQLQQQQVEDETKEEASKGGDETDSYQNKHEKLRRIERLLRLHSMETPELSQQYHLQRKIEQRRLQRNASLPYLGLLTIRAHFVEDKLRIEIMNARNIRPMDSSGSCDPYVKVHILPEEKFATVSKPRTKTHKKNLFPLFDEIFTISLTSEQRAVKDGMLLFIVKDQDFLGNEFIGEAYLPFEDIPKSDVTVGLETMQQVHLKLNRPQNLPDSDVIKALEHRQGDKLARDFVKRQKTKAAEVKQVNGA